MQLIVTNKQMREADVYTITEKGVSGWTLMQRAGTALADVVQTHNAGKRILCICGGGNNGGDGYICASELLRRGENVHCLALQQPKTEECKKAYAQWLAVGGAVLETLPAMQSYVCIVDCIFGTGFHGEFPYAGLAKAIEESGAKVISCDIPSGVNGDNGRVETTAIRADITLCIGEKKAGVYLTDGIDYCGEIIVADIGIQLPLPTHAYVQVLQRDGIAGLLPKRKRNTHKGSYGKAALLAGSAEYSGAAYLSALSCLRAGAGYTVLFAPKTVVNAAMGRYPELLLKTTNDGDRYAFNESVLRDLLGYDAIACGMGMGDSEDVARAVIWLLTHYQGKLIIDADGINSLAHMPCEEWMRALQNKTCDVVLTPHIKEFSRLTGKDVQTLLNQGLQAATAFAETYGVTVLLKNAVTIIADETNVKINVSGCAGQAKGGSGDVLSGVIISLCATGLSGFDGACAATYLCGVAAEFACRDFGERSMLPSDVISYLGRAFLSLSEPENADK